MIRADQVMEILQEVEPYLAFHGEVQFIDGRYSIGGGTWTKFYHTDKSDLDTFEGTNKKTAAKQGQRYIMMLIEVQDDELPVNQDKRKEVEDIHAGKGGQLCRLAAMLCRQDDFVMFANRSIAADKMPFNKDSVKSFIYETCGITSRAELDHNQDAANRFHTFIRIPYMTSKGEYTG